MQIVDTAVKTYVTRFASATDLIDGRRCYIVATLLWLCYLIGSVPPQGAIAHALLYPRVFLCSADLYLNVRGLFGRRDDRSSDGALVVNETDHDFTRLNTALRPYLVMAAVALVIAFITSGLVISFDFRWLRWAIALGALSASMYLKDLDPKLAHRRREAGRRPLLAAMAERPAMNGALTASRQRQYHGNPLFLSRRTDHTLMPRCCCVMNQGARRTELPFGEHAEAAKGKDTAT